MDFGESARLFVCFVINFDAPMLALKGGDLPLIMLMSIQFIERSLYRAT